MEITVRAATLADAPAIRDLASAAWRDTYDGLLAPATIEAFIQQRYSLDQLAGRIRSRLFLVAETNGGIIAFGDARLESDCVKLVAIYADPVQRGRGAGTRLLAAIREHFPGLPIAADVLDGNRNGESFYEAHGFIPRETLKTDLLGEAVVERRWWLEAER